jgi:DNA helicase-2/ATP-dependent DNA helicase PcrA
MIWFASNRRIHGLWQSAVPSRFIEELPAAEIEIVEHGPAYGGYGVGGMGGSYGPSRFDRAEAFTNTYETPGWQRAQRNRANQGDLFGGSRRGDRPAAATTGPADRRDRRRTGGQERHAELDYASASASSTRSSAMARLGDRGHSDRRLRQGRPQARHRQLRRAALAYNPAR